VPVFIHEFEIALPKLPDGRPPPAQNRRSWAGADAICGPPLLFDRSDRTLQQSMPNLHGVLVYWVPQKSGSSENTGRKQRTVVMEGARAMRRAQDRRGDPGP
jgi:hypothetical protein